MSASFLALALRGYWILEENYKSKKLELKTSLRALHKQSTLQNMPFWEDK